MTKTTTRPLPSGRRPHHRMALPLALPLLAALAATLAAGSARADDDGIATDRPDFVESSNTVGKGRFQLETSLAFERDRQAGIRSKVRSTPTLLRYGIADDWELRLETDGALRAKVTEAGVTTKQSGMADSAVGVKWHVLDGDEATHRPGMAWLFHLDLETGSRAFRGQGTRPSVRLTAEWDLPKDFSVGVMGGVYLERNDDGKRYTGGILAVTAGIPLAENWRGFVEVAGQELASNRNGGKVITFDTGITWQLDKSLQLDMALSRGINKNAPDLAWTVGMSVRF